MADGVLTTNPGLQAEARAAAADADLVIVTVGEPSDLSGEPGRAATSGFPATRNG